MTKKDHHELVARLATSNISTEDFSYLTSELIESRTCENCKWDEVDGNYCFLLTVEDMKYCNKWEKKDEH